MSLSQNVVDLSQLETQVEPCVNPGCTFDNCMLLLRNEHNSGTQSSAIIFYCHGLMTTKMPFDFFTAATQQKLKTTPWYFHCVQTWFCIFSKK